jgi:uncharacterized phage-associated protein
MGKEILPRPKIEDLIQEILKEEWNRGNKQILTIKLIKLLYLAEYEYYRKHRQRLTELKWVFYKYGPFAFELRNVQRNIVNLEEEERELDSGMVIKLLGIASAYDFIEERFISDFEIGSIIKNLVSDWKNKSTKELLNYVYHHTEPMIFAEKLKEIDFSVITEAQFSRVARTSDERIREIRKFVKSRKHIEVKKALYPLPELTEEWKARAKNALKDLEIEDSIIHPDFNA